MIEPKDFASALRTPGAYFNGQPNDYWIIMHTDDGKILSSTKRLVEFQFLTAAS